jgi:monothiol glutaredoxin
MTLPPILRGKGPIKGPFAIGRVRVRVPFSHSHRTSTLMTTEEKIQQQIASNPILLYMKGVPENPECGFSAKAVAALKATGLPFAYVNVLAAPFIREKLPKISHWPTYPQLFVDGELVGGSDIVEEMVREGTLKPLLEKAAGKAVGA